jgi:hypothetical protein
LIVLIVSVVNGIVEGVREGRRIRIERHDGKL